MGKWGLMNNRLNNRKQERYQIPSVSHDAPHYGGETYEAAGMTKHGLVAETEKKLANENRRFLRVQWYRKRAHVSRMHKSLAHGAERRILLKVTWDLAARLSSGARHATESGRRNSRSGGSHHRDGHLTVIWQPRREYLVMIGHSPIC